MKKDFPSMESISISISISVNISSARQKNKEEESLVQIEEEIFVNLHLESNQNNRAKIPSTNQWKKDFIRTSDKRNLRERTVKKEDHHFLKFRERRRERPLCELSICQRKNISKQRKRER